MYTIIDWLSRPFQGNTEKRVKTLLLRHNVYRGVTDVVEATPAQKWLGVDLVVHINKRIVFLQLQPNYRWANIAKRHTYANVAIIVANNATSEELLTSKLITGLDYFQYP